MKKRLQKARIRGETNETGGPKAAQLITPRGEEPETGRPLTPPARVLSYRLNANRLLIRQPYPGGVAVCAV